MPSVRSNAVRPVSQSFALKLRRDLQPKSEWGGFDEPTEGRARVRPGHHRDRPEPIKSEAAYTAALQEIERLWDAEPGTPESDTLENLVTLVEAYEKGRYDLPPPDPAAALEYFLESRRPAVPPGDR